MRRIVYTAGALALLSLLMAPASPLFAAPVPDGPSSAGLWKIDGDLMGRPVQMMCTLREAAHKLSGTCSGAADGFTPHQITGTVKGQKLELYFQTYIGGNAITLIVSGTLNNDRSKMDGDLDVEPMSIGGTFAGVRQGSGETPATAKRRPEISAPVEATAASPRVASASVPAPPTAAAGTWKVDADVRGTAVKMTCVIGESESKLTGTCTGEDTKACKLTGSVTAKGLAWHFDAEYQGNPITVVMFGTMDTDGTKMNGTMAVSPMDADGTFVAVKQQGAVESRPSTAPAN